MYVCKYYKKKKDIHTNLPESEGVCMYAYVWERERVSKREREREGVNKGNRVK